MEALGIETSFCKTKYRDYNRLRPIICRLNPLCIRQGFHSTLPLNRLQTFGVQMGISHGLQRVRMSEKFANEIETLPRGFVA